MSDATKESAAPKGAAIDKTRDNEGCSFFDATFDFSVGFLVCVSLDAWPSLGESVFGKYLVIFMLFMLFTSSCKYAHWLFSLFRADQVFHDKLLLAAILFGAMCFVVFSYGEKSQSADISPAPAAEMARA